MAARARVGGAGVPVTVLSLQPLLGRKRSESHDKVDLIF